MTLEQIQEKADSFFEFPTKNRDHVTTTSALLFARECCKDSDVNADWLSMAHELCTDYGVDQGHISQRLLILRRKMVDMQTSLAGRTYFHSDASVEARVSELEAAIITCLNNNGHLADGGNCALIDLKRAMPTWELE